MNKHPEFLYKYRNFEDPYMINIIKNSSLYFSQAKNFNDPFDLRLNFNENLNIENLYDLSKLIGVDKDSIKDLNVEELNEEIKRKNKEVYDKIGILSLSADLKNILMWSHYANNHSGLVFEFKNKNLYFKNATKVRYSDKYEILDFTNINPIKRIESMKDSLLLKYSDWQYEHEYRLINIYSNGEERFDKLDLSSIIFGLETTAENIDMIKKLCTENGFEHVKFKKTERVYGKFELKIVDL